MQMTIDSINTYLPRYNNAQASNEANVIDLDAIKAILYLGIKGEIYLPMKEQHTIDTFAWILYNRVREKDYAITD